MEVNLTVNWTGNARLLLKFISVVLTWCSLNDFNKVFKASKFTPTIEEHEQ